MYFAASLSLGAVLLLCVVAMQRLKRLSPELRREANVAMLGALPALLLAAIGTAVDISTSEPLWAIVGAGTGVTVGGFRLGRKHIQLDAFWLVVGLAFGIALISFFLSRSSVDIASSWLQALLVSPFLLWALGYLAHSIGDLYGVPERGRVERWIAQRWLMARSGTTLSVVTAISVAGVALGTWLVIVALAILSGFENDLTQKIIGAHAHIEILDDKRDRVVLAEDEIDWLNQAEFIDSWSRTIEREVAVASSSNYARTRVQGIDWKRGRETFRIISDVEWTGGDESGQKVDDEPADPFAFVAPKALPGIVIGVEMARNLNLRVGETLRVVSPVLTTTTPVGSAPKSQGFEVVGLFHSKMYEYDAHFAFMDIRAARRFFEVPDGAFDKVQIRAKDLGLVESLQNQLKDVFNVGEWRLLDWRTRNQTLFAALQLERVVSIVVLTFIILVASFSVVTTLAMSVIEKTPEIAILRTVGASARSVVKVFLWQGLIVGGAGIGFGVMFAGLTIYALEHIGVWIPNDVYYIDSLPVAFDWGDLILIVVGALIVLWNFSMIPARRAAKLLPVEGLREG